ncbi:MULTISPECIES: hypothetical protein [Rhodomicrobium]|uniref:hypothetical protein n=1 Tax=Rhodomicrobium TaxID=1068 RepID=UPI000B4ADB44|nr:MULTISPECIES: hypothetical protein [Rhodomicrobium]
MASNQDSLMAELRSIRHALAEAAGGKPSALLGPVRRALDRLERCLARPLRMAVLGEENAGKSLLINYLLKHQVLPSGAFAGEGNQLLIRYAAEPAVHAVSPDGSRNRLTSKAFGRLIKPETVVARAMSASVIYDAATAGRSGPRAPMIGPGDLVGAPRKTPQAPMRLIEIGLPLDFLRHLEIVEVRASPDGALTSPSRRAFRKVDFSIWCTLATQAWKETEAAAFRRIAAANRKSALMLVTYKDAVRRGRDEEKIIARLRHAGGKLFDNVVLVSLRDALQSLLSPDADDARRLFADSNIEAAETAIRALADGRQQRRYRKAAGLLRHAAERLASHARQAGGAGLDTAARLNRLAAEFLDASPSLSLAERAA